MKRVNIMNENPIEIKRGILHCQILADFFVTFQSFEIGGLTYIQKLDHIVTV